jgi:hypothetical protein
MVVPAKEFLHAQAKRREHPLIDFLARELTLADPPVQECDGDLGHSAAEAHTSGQHFHQKGVSVRTNILEGQLLDHLPAITAITGGPVANALTENMPGKLVGCLAQLPTEPGPVCAVPALDVS